MNVKENGKWILEAPLKVSIIYLVFTAILYFLGPLEYNINNELTLIFFLFLYFLFFYLGYISYLKTRKISKESNIEKSLNNKFEFTIWIRRIFWISGIYSICKFIIYTYTYYGGFQLDALFDLGSSYYERLYNTGDGTWITALFIYSNFISFFWFPIGTIYWKRMGLIEKYFFIFTLLFQIVYWLNQGTIKGIGDIIIISIPSFILLYWRYKFLSKKESKSSKKKIFFMIVCISFFLIIFSTAQEKRNDYRGNDSTIITANNSAFILDESDFVLPYLTNYLTFYLTHGYTGMSLALNLDHEWTYGVGFSRDLMRLVERNLDVEISDHTYTQRIEDHFGWPNGMYWPTAFVWFASDLTFWGIPIFLFIFGRFFAYSWCSFVTEHSVLSLVVVCQSFIFIIFLPANNQLFQSSENLYANLLLFFLILFRGPFLKDINNRQGKNTKFR